MSIVITLTGAAGQIGYSIVPMICNGDLTGKEKKLIINLLDIPQCLKDLEGFNMELTDGAYPLVEKVNLCTDPEIAFKDCDLAILFGAFPRGPGMERKDLLKKNANIFKVQGAAIEKVAKKSCKILVVGNPANTNALILSKYCPSIPKYNITSMSRLDHNRAKAQLAAKSKFPISEIKNVFIWGNHSNTQVPDVDNGTIGGKSIREVINDDNYLSGEFIKTVATRGTSVIAARGGKSSAASAAKAAVDAMKDWIDGTDEIISMGVYSDGSFGIEKEIIYSFPVKVINGKWEIQKSVKVTECVKEMMKVSEKELIEEKKIAFEYLDSMN